MTSYTTEKFRHLFSDLPEDIKRKTRKAYQLFQQDPFHPGVRFKKVHRHQPIYSVRIDAAYRALGVREDDAMIWFWIGSHDEYERMLSAL